MVKASCGCEYDLSNDHIIEFYQVCPKHQPILEDFLDILKEVMRETAHRIATKSKLVGAWK